VVHVAMDEHGLVPTLLRETLSALATRGVTPKFLYTIPNFQNPTGVTQTVERRRCRLNRMAVGVAGPDHVEDRLVEPPPARHR